MSAATMERKGHPAERKAKLKKGGFSEGSELSPEKIEALDALPDNASVDQIRAVVSGKGKTTVRKVSVKYPEPVREAYKRALDLTGTPEKGGPKYPLTVKQADAIKKALSAKGKAALEAGEALGKVSDAALRKIAKGQDAPKEAVAAVRGFLKAHVALKEDRTMYARKGAALVLAYREAE